MNCAADKSATRSRPEQERSDQQAGRRNASGARRDATRKRSDLLRARRRLTAHVERGAAGHGPLRQHGAAATPTNAAPTPGVDKPLGSR